MTDHAVVVATAEGPVGAVVSEPDGEPRGALVLLQGGGPASRAGVNAIWARIARDLAALGLVVLRFDFAREGDSTLVGREIPRDVGRRRSTDLALLRQLVPWFLAQVDERELLLAGSCYGGRVALEFTATDSAARGLFLVIPYLWHSERSQAGQNKLSSVDWGMWARGATLDSDEAVVEGFRTCLARGPVWVLCGEDEAEQVLPFAQRLEETGPSFELELSPGMPLHPVGHPEQQSQVRRRLVARISRELAERVPN